MGLAYWLSNVAYFENMKMSCYRWCRKSVFPPKNCLGLRGLNTPITMRTFALLSIIAIALTSCGEVIRGNGNVIKTERELADFHKIKTSGAYEIVLIEGGHRIEIQTDENLHEHITTSVEEGALVISSEGKHLQAEELTLLIYFEELDEIDMSGAVELSSKEILEGKGLEIELSGAGDIDLKLDVEQFEMELSGGGDVDLSGVAHIVDMEITGAGDVRALGLITEEATLDITGAGEVEITVEKMLDVEITGAGEVKYSGSPEVKQSITGAGELKQVEA